MFAIVLFPSLRCVERHHGDISALDLTLFSSVFGCPFNSTLHARGSLHSPLDSDMPQGTLVPRVVQKGRHRRRIISIELHRIEHPQTQDAKNIGSTNIDTPSFYDECVVRVLVPIPRVNRRKNNNKAKNDDDVDDDVEEEDSTTMIAAEFLDHESTEIIFPSNGSSNNNNINDSGQQYATEEITGWVAKYRFPLQKMSIKGTHHHSVIIELLMGKRREVREVVFDSLPEAERFQTVLRNEMAMEQSRILAKTKFSMGGENIRLDDQITFLVEIVSGWNLPAADFSSSDPFVTCLLNNKEVHRTAYISKTLDPVWSASTGSLFLLIVDVQELFAGEGLICIVYDFDKVGANDMLGAVTISPLTMYHANGERMEFKLGLAPGQKITDIPGYMAFRVRHATENDKVFMAQYGKTNWMIPNLTETKKPDSHEHKAKGGKGNIMSMVTRRSRMCKSGGNAGLLEYKVRPCPDPKRKEETTWMTKTHIDSECLQDSSHWVDAGNGTLGRIFVEILHCDDLPNLDAGGFAGNKTDTFVCLVYEDAVAQTDVIDDTLMPRWLPWTRRAFIFHMLHGSSELFLGVFDHDDGINPTDDHDLIGRVSVDLSNLRKDTVYTLQYNIYTTARMTARKKKGSITIRLRIEFDDERNLLLSTIEPPPKLYVNVKTRKEFRVVRYTCTGKYNMEKYNMKFIDS